MGREKNAVGRAGEDAAIGLLKKKGYKIIAVNYRTYFGEIDAIARKGDVIVFIEVKTRTSASLGPPFLSITETKKRHIVRNALSYLARRGLVDSFWRIDVVSIMLNAHNNAESIEIIENAVEDIE